MSLKIDRVELEIVIKNDESRKRLRELDEEMRKLSSNLKKLPKDSQEWIDKSEQLKKLKVEYDKIYDKIGLTNLSLKELMRRQQELTSILAQVPGDSPLYKKYKEQLDQVKNRMRELRGTAQETGMTLSSMAEGMNKYWLTISSGLAIFTGLGMAINKLAENVAKMDDIYSDVMKTTGMTHEQTVLLNEEFKKMDTRTSREELNKLASEAGKLGKLSTKDVLDFVEAGNQIRVALGEDLGKDAIINIGKIAEVFKTSQNDLKKLDLKQQMLSIGSAINALGNASSASEPYLVEFTKRMAGVASQSGISLQSILGFGSALDQAGQNVEMSATSLQGLIIKIFEDPAKFAKMAGKNVKEFSHLLRTDANQAIMSVITALNKKGGFEALIPVFNDMQLDGKRAISVLATLATNVDMVTEAQQVANSEFTKGISITNEYSTKNKNLQAELEKARKRFSDVALDLGAKLSPTLIGATHFSGSFIKAIISIINFTAKNREVILTLVTAITAYTVATMAQTFWAKRNLETSILNIAINKLKVFWDNAATAATALHAAAIFLLNGNLKMANQTMRIFFVTIGLNPIALLTAGLIAAATALYFLASKSNEAQTKIKTLMDLQKEAAKQTAAQKTELELLLEVARSNNYSLEERRKAMARINEISPQYLGNITLENLGKRESIKAIDDYILALDREAIAKATQDKMTEVRAQQMENNLKIKDIETYKSKTIAGSESSMIYDGKIADLKKENQELEIKAGFLKEIYKDSTVTVVPTRNVKTIQDEMTARKVLLDKELADNKITNDEYHRQLILSEKKYRSELESFKQDERKKAEKQKQQQAKLDVLNAQFKKEKEAIDKQHKSKLISENEYQNQMDELTKKFQQKKSVIFSPKEKSKKDFSTSTSETDSTSETAANKALEKQLKAEEDAYKSAQAKIKIRQSKDLENEEKYLDELDKLELNYLAQKKATLKAAGQSTGEVELQIANKKVAMVEKVQKELEKKALKATKDEKEEADKQLKILETKEAEELALLEEKRNSGVFSESAYQAQLLAIEADYLGRKLKLVGLSEEKIETLKKQLIENKAKGNDNDFKDRASFTDKYASDEQKLKSWKSKERQILDDYLKRGIISEKEAKSAQSILDREYNLKKLEGYSKTAQEIANIAGNLSSAAQGFQQAEEMSVNLKYAKLIKAAGKNQRQITKLEDKKEKELAELRKKWADKQFVLTVAQVVAQTAVAAISAYASAVKVPIVGPVLAPIAAAAAVTAGAAQLAVANQARQQASEGLYAGGFSQDYVEGFTSNGNPREEAGVISVHKDEFVGNHQGVRNPHVKQFYDVFNMAQKSGRIGMLNTTEILSNLKMKGLFEGGFSRFQPAANAPVDKPLAANIASMADISKLAAILGKLNDKLDKPIRANVSVTGRDGINENQKLYAQMMSNKSRGG